MPELNDLTVAHGESETYLHSIDEVCHELPIPLGCSDAGVSSHGDDWKQAVSYPDGLSATTVAAGSGGSGAVSRNSIQTRDWGMLLPTKRFKEGSGDGADCVLSLLV